MDYNELDGNIGEENFAEEMPDNGADTMEHHHDKKGEESTHKLTGMYKNWFLDYAS